MPIHWCQKYENGVWTEHAVARCDSCSEGIGWYPETEEKARARGTGVTKRLGRVQLVGALRSCHGWLVGKRVLCKKCRGS